jgi:Na+/melibiose symporter-like transporter
LAIPRFVLLWVQLDTTLSPSFYYATQALTGLVNFIALSLSALSDLLPKNFRAPCFGILLAGFCIGFAFSPLLALALGHIGTSAVASALLLGGVLYTLRCMPETLPEDVRETALANQRAEAEASASTSCLGTAGRVLLRPLREVSILNRDRLFRTLAGLAFFSGIVQAVDQQLLVYYAENTFSFTDADVAKLFAEFGLLGVFVQAIVFRPLVACVGERLVLTIAFMFGTFSNLAYGTANCKGGLFLGAALGAPGSMSFPTISAIKSNNVAESEQGRVQGALYAVQSLAMAVGPLFLRWVKRLLAGQTASGGVMFLVAAGLYIIASGLACTLPRERTDYSRLENKESMAAPKDMEQDSTLHEPLLAAPAAPGLGA